MGYINSSGQWDWGNGQNGDAPSDMSKGGTNISGALGKVRDAITDPFKRTSQYGQVDPDGMLGDQSRRAGGFANAAQGQFGQLGRESAESRDHLRRLASGQDSISAEQLRQSLQQNLGGQMSMAAGARPGNAAMAARTAANNAANMGAGLAGQQAMAGIAERQAAQQSLANMLMQQRQQELQAALGARGQAIQGFGAMEQARTSRYGADMGTPTAAQSLLGSIPGAR